MYISGVREVRKVEVQVVEGILYKIHVIMGNTPCRKTSALKQCTVHGDSELTRPYECTFRVWQRPWLGETQVWEKCP
ncbi:cystatin-C [Xyrichtys novacula]|nr:cystatin-C [Xyrichtys novacula]